MWGEIERFLHILSNKKIMMHDITACAKSKYRPCMVLQNTGIFDFRKTHSLCIIFWFSSVQCHPIGWGHFEHQANLPCFHRQTTMGVTLNTFGIFKKELHKTK